jgi:hypothetical protein
VNAFLAVALLTIDAGAGLPAVPDVGPVIALAPRPSGECNAATFFAKAEKAFFAKSRETDAPLSADDPAMIEIRKGMACRSAVFPYSKTLALPPTDQRIPASRPYRAAAETFLRSGRQLLQAGQLNAAEAEFRKLIVLGTLLYEEPGITVIQDTISLSLLSRGAEGLGDAALARGDAATARVCARFVTAARAYLEGASGFVKTLSYRGLLDRPVEQQGTVSAIAALDTPTLRPALRLEILMFIALARPLLGATSASVDRTLERASRDRDPRIKALGEWALGLSAQDARRIIGTLATSPWP